MANMTLSQRIARALAEDIIKGNLKPGERLDEQSLAERFEVSRSPIRDALRELAVTRLVEQKPRRGFAVAVVDTAKLRDLFEASSEMDSLCARYCALRADALERQRIEDLHNQGEEASRSGDTDAYAEINRELHLAIYEACHNETLRDVAIELRKRLSAFRARFLFSNERVKSSQEEHAVIVGCIVNYDADGAAEAMKQHIARTALNIVRHMSAAGN